MVFWVWLIVPLVIGFGLGYWLSALDRKNKYVGTLRVDRSDPTEAPYLFLELEPDGMAKIHKQKSVVFKVNLENYLPRK